MSKYYESICAICCYYVGEGSHKLVCEGFYDKSNMHMTFPSNGAKREHMEKFCYSYDYENCPVARMLEQAQAAGEKEAPRAESRELRAES